MRCALRETKISIQTMFLSCVPQFWEYFISKCSFFPLVHLYNLLNSWYLYTPCIHICIFLSVIIQIFQNCLILESNRNFAELKFSISSQNLLDNLNSYTKVEFEGTISNRKTDASLSSFFQTESQSSFIMFRKMALLKCL